VLSRSKPTNRARKQSTRQPPSFAGDLRIISSASLLQLVEMNRTNGVLHFVSARARGWLRFEDGVIVEATTEDLNGEDAAFMLCSLTEGTFAFEPAKALGLPAMMTVQTLLLESAWVIDELKRAPEHVPGPEDSVRIVDRANAEPCFPDNEAWKTLLANEPRDFFPIAHLRELLGIGMLRCRSSLAKAIEDGAIELIRATVRPVRKPRRRMPVRVSVLALASAA
jgi:hypothetical protein